ncbi:hypothetical protein Bbelb_253310 [Branchiostoma belcheri]|nr:hypothetical protein Bbelb_253310 [Branchiostoma belcheri]
MNQTVLVDGLSEPWDIFLSTASPPNVTNGGNEYLASVRDVPRIGRYMESPVFGESYTLRTLKIPPHLSKRVGDPPAVSGHKIGDTGRIRKRDLLGEPNALPTAPHDPTSDVNHTVN